MKEKTKIIAEIALNALFIIISLLAMFISKDYSSLTSSDLGAKTFPLIVSILLIVFASINIIGASLKISKCIEKRESDSTNTKDNVEQKTFASFAAKNRTVCAIFVCCAYYLGLTFIGFILSTLLFLPTMLTLLEYKKKRNIVLITILATGLIYICFRILLGVPLPEGIFFE